jgi:hypothetical protein
MKMGYCTWCKINALHSFDSNSSRKNREKEPNLTFKIDVLYIIHYLKEKLWKKTICKEQDFQKTGIMLYYLYLYNT